MGIKSRMHTLDLLGRFSALQNGQRPDERKV